MRLRWLRFDVVVINIIVVIPRPPSLLELKVDGRVAGRGT